MLDVSLGGALLAGILSFISPCILPIVPPYLAWLAGISFDQLSDEKPSSGQKWRIIRSAIFFVLGFSTVFVALGATSSAIGGAITQYYDIISIVAGIIIMIMGLHFIGVFKIGLLYREARVNVQKKPAGLVGAYVVGLAFAFGWTPCVGPVLAAILFVASSQDTAARGALLLASYSVGIGVPFILAAAFASQFLGWASKFRKHMRTVEIVLGVLLIITGILFATRQMSAISYWLLETFPAFSTIG